MLNQLLETKQATHRKTGGTMVSVVLHVLVIAAAMQFTQHTASALAKPDEVVVKAPVSPPEQVKPRDPSPVDAVRHGPAPLGVPVLSAPVDVPVDIPAVNLDARPTDAADWVGAAGPVGAPDGIGVGVRTGDAPFQSFEVDKPAASIAGSAAPAYPEMLKASGVEGNALVQFVVDTLGRAEPGSFAVLQATHDAFGTAVRSALPRMRFLPAESGGRKVRMLVQQRFGFTLDR